MKPIFYVEGHTVMIYQKPVTQEDPEGKARLERFVGKEDNLPYMETWEVRFHHDKNGDAVQRQLLPGIRMEESDKATTSDLISKEYGTFTVIAARESQTPGKSVVLGFRRLTGDFRGITADYVVWIHSKTTDCFFWGHYYNDFLKAVEDYKTRV